VPNALAMWLSDGYILPMTTRSVAEAAHYAPLGMRGMAGRSSGTDFDATLSAVQRLTELWLVLADPVQRALERGHAIPRVEPGVCADADRDPAGRPRASTEPPEGPTAGEATRLTGAFLFNWNNGKKATNHKKTGEEGGGQFLEFLGALFGGGGVESSLEACAKWAIKELRQRGRSRN